MLKISALCNLESTVRCTAHHILHSLKYVLARWLYGLQLTMKRNIIHQVDRFIPCFRMLYTSFISEVLGYSPFLAKRMPALSYRSYTLKEQYFSLLHTILSGNSAWVYWPIPTFLSSSSRHLNKILLAHPDAIFRSSNTYFLGFCNLS